MPSALPAKASVETVEAPLSEAAVVRPSAFVAARECAVAMAADGQHVLLLTELCAVAHTLPLQHRNAVAAAAAAASAAAVVAGQG